MIDPNAVLDTVTTICSHGPRFMGGLGAAKVLEYLLERFRKLGLEDEAFPFEYLGYAAKEASISVEGKQLRCEPMAYSGVTDAPVEGRLVYAGQCGQEELDALAAQGVNFSKSIILSDNLRSFVAYPQASERGAAGFVLATTLEDDTIRCGGTSIDGQPGDIPGVFISGPDSRECIASLLSGKPLRARLSHRADSAPMIGHNAVARIPGRKGPKVIVSAHYDSMWNGVHAMDNAAGSALVLHLAEVLPAMYEDNFEFVIFAAEEVGLKGSLAYYEAVKDQTRIMINHDTMGSVRSGLEIGCSKDIREECERIMAKTGLRVDVWNTPPREASDQVHFVRGGLPAVWIANAGKDPYYHTPRDVPEAMSAERMSLAIEASLAMFEGFCTRS